MRPIVRLGLGLLALGCSLMLLEGAVRLSGLAPGLPKVYADPIYLPDPHLPYRQAPSISRDVLSRTGEFREVFTHNSAGFRDVEHTLAKPANTFRILGLGDSFTYGAAAPFAQTWLVLLERKLNERPGPHPAVEIVKAGVGGFFPEAERLLLEHQGLAYEPDLVIVGFNPTDLFESWLGVDEVRVHDGFLKTAAARRLGRVGTTLYMRSHVARTLLEAAARARWRRATREFEHQREKAWRKVEAEYDRMLALLPPHTRLAIVFIPFGNPPPPEETRRLRAYGESRGLLFVDASPVLSVPPDGDGPNFWPKDGHCTPKGYAILAEAVFAALTRDGLVP